MKSVFLAEDVQEIKQRIEKLTASTPRLWGKMTVGQMLAHCSVTYEMFFEEGKYPTPNFLMRFILKAFVKSKVVGESLYKQNSPTAPQFLILEDKNFESEKKRLLEYIDQTFALGKAHFEGKKSLSFGVLTAQEWNNMMYKHLDHHLKQFGC